MLNSLNPSLFSVKSAAEQISRFLWTSVLVTNDAGPCLPVFFGAVVQSQLSSMGLLHLDATRTSLFR